MYDPNIHHRRSIRLKEYNYAKVGWYFVTICVQNGVCLFGEINEGHMVLNDAGKMIEKWYQELESKYPDKKCHEMVIMPNHFHCIIENRDFASYIYDVPLIKEQGHQRHEQAPHSDVSGTYGPDNKRYNAPLGLVMDWFKTMTTNEYIRGVKKYEWPRFPGRLWQRNYWEHIIRNDQSYQHIANYILTNPENWERDRLNPELGLE